MSPHFRTKAGAVTLSRTVMGEMSRWKRCRKIIAAPSTDEPLGTVIALGTPFMDTMSPILERAGRASRILNIASWIGFAVIAVVALSYIMGFPLIGVPLLILLGIGVWFARALRTGRVDPYRTAQGLPPLFAMGSLMDEPWQVLHHMRTIQNPLAVKTNALSYLFFSLRSNILQNKKVARIRGAKSYCDLGIVAKFVMAITHAATVFVILILLFAVRGALVPGAFTQTQDVIVPVAAVLFPAIAIFIFVLFLTRFFGGRSTRPTSHLFVGSRRERVPSEVFSIGWQRM